jgi:LysR family transcriptional regulator of abg operon
MRGRSLKLHHFRDAVAIAEHGSMRAAARHLGIAQPTLTHGLSDLERELGAPLFERRSRGMMLTPLGEAFVRRATAILNARERGWFGRGRPLYRRASMAFA